MDSSVFFENNADELEILEFTIAGHSYGIKVFDIVEIISYQKSAAVPNSHPSIEGVVTLRDKTLVAVDLRNCLDLGKSNEDGMFIIARIFNSDIAFHVDNVLGIYRVNRNQIEYPDAAISAIDGTVSVGVARVNQKLILILDFQKILKDMNPYIKDTMD